MFPFTSIVGQEDLKLALILNLIDPKIGGVLITGEKGTGKTTAVRSLNNINLDKGNINVVELPINATEDRVVGSIDLEKAIKEGEKELQPGILFEANENILYVDEINLLNDYIVDVLLDAAAMGVNIIEREGISYSHPSQFILIGTMNPEEGDLRPQLLDRFGMCVEVVGVEDKEERKQIIKNRLEFEDDKKHFIGSYENKEKELEAKINKAILMLNKVKVTEDALDKIIEIGIALNVDGHRGDIILLRASKAYAAYLHKEIVELEDIKRVVNLVYTHRLKRLPFEQVSSHTLDLLEEVLNE